MHGPHIIYTIVYDYIFYVYDRISIHRYAADLRRRTGTGQPVAHYDVN